MTLHVATASMRYYGNDRLNVTTQSGGADGRPFAPSWDLHMLGRLLHHIKSNDALVDLAWESYAERYRAEMAESQWRCVGHWETLLTRDRVVLVCYCRNWTRCHRRLLAQILAELGAVNDGEL